MKNQIEAIQGKVEAAYQTLIAVAEDREFKKIRMQAVWTLIQTCILPIITYASETWHLKKQESKKLNQILDKILRRVLMTPDATPREALYIETGLLDIETVSESKRLNMKARLNRDKSKMMEHVLNNPGCTWEIKTADVMGRYGIEPHDLTGNKYSTKTNIKRKTLEQFKEKIKEKCTDKSKIRYFSEGKNEWTPGTRAKYMNEMTRKQVSVIFKARTRMMKIKGNYKNGNKNQTCRACKQEPETQDHVLEMCPEIHKTEDTKVKKSQLFSENTDTLKLIAKKIDTIMNSLE